MSGQYQGAVTVRLPGPDREHTTVTVHRPADADLVWLTVAGGAPVVMTTAQTESLINHLTGAKERGSS